MLDEVSQWRDEGSANPGAEVLAALRPCLGGVPGSMLLAASSPAGREGILWRAYQRHHGKDDADVDDASGPSAGPH